MSAKPSQTRLRAQIGTLQRRLSALNAETDGSARRLLGDAARFLGAALARLQAADEKMEQRAPAVRDPRRAAALGGVAWSPQGSAAEEETIFASVFHSAFDDAPVGMVIARPDGFPLRVNRALCEMVGYSAAELVVMHPNQIAHPDDAPLAAERLAASMAGRDPGGTLDLRYLHKNGQVVWARVAGSLVHDTSGEPSHVIVQIENITERKQIERALQENESQFRTLAETAAALIFIIQGTRFRYANAAAEALTGYGRAELLDGDWFKVIAPEYRELARLRAEARQQGATLQGRDEVQILAKDGTRYWVEFSAAPITYDGAPAILGTAFDITERQRVSQALRRSEEALRASEAKNKAILEASPDTFIRIRRDGTILDVKGDTSAWRTPAAETMGRMIGDLMPPDMAAPALETIQRAISTGEMQTYELETPTAHGVVFLEARIVACGEDEALCSLRDMTARRRAEHEARQRLTELAHVARVSNMGEMAAALAHELNQPLMAIVGYASGCALRVEAGTIEPPELQNALRHVSHQAVRAGEILRRLRDFVRKGPPQRSRVDVNSLAREVRGLADVEAREHAVLLRLELDETLPEVSVDPIQIEQVMLNLIRNGMEAMSETTAPRVLTLRTRRASADAVAVTVVDCGKGLPSGIEDLFEPFVTTKPKGLGLGLSISRSIVEAHGGRLSAWSEDGPTTVFELTLPVARGGTR